MYMYMHAVTYTWRPERRREVGLHVAVTIIRQVRLRKHAFYMYDVHDCGMQNSPMYPIMETLEHVHVHVCMKHSCQNNTCSCILYMYMYSHTFVYALRFQPYLANGDILAF